MLINKDGVNKYGSLLDSYQDELTSQIATSKQRIRQIEYEYNKLVEEQMRLKRSIESMKKNKDLCLEMIEMMGRSKDG